jgi:hypothetical protein
MSKAIEKRAETAQDFENKLIELKKNIGENTWSLAEILKEVFDNEYYKELGYETFTLWLSSPEIDMSKQLGYRLVDMYKIYVVENKVKHAVLSITDYTKLSKILPIVKKDPSKMDEWLEKARLLRRSDLEREVRLATVIEQKEEVAKVREIEKVEHPEVQTEAKAAIVYKSLKDLDQIPDHSVHCVITYPPAGNYDWIEKIVQKLTPDGSVFIIGDHNTTFDIAPMCVYRGLTLIRDIIWYHKTPSKPPTVETLMSCHKTILWYRLGEKYTNNLVEYTKDVIEIDFDVSSSHERDIHLQLANQLIDMSSHVGDTVLDPFCGVGTILDAAKRMGRNIIGIEEDEYWFTLTKTRLTNV